MDWHKLKEKQPPPQKNVLVSDGLDLAFAMWTSDGWAGVSPWIKEEEIKAWAEMPEPPIVWYSVSEKCPKPGQTILAKLRGCKIGKFVYMKIREGEGLGHIKEWSPHKEYYETVFEEYHESS